MDSRAVAKDSARLMGVTAATDPVRGSNCCNRERERERERPKMERDDHLKLHLA